MVDVTTTFTFELEQAADSHALVVAELPADAEHLRAQLSTQLGARWPNSDQHFQIQFQYTPTADRLLRQAGITNFAIRPSDPRLPLTAIVDEAVERATRREGWEVRAVDVIEETVSHVVLGSFDTLVLRGTFTVRVTQTR